jgi:hypothetical protein
VSEIKTPLRKVLREDGDTDWVIEPEHSFADVIRHLISEGATLADFTVTWAHRLEDR